MVEVETPEGPGRFYLRDAPSPQALLIMGHGAGGGVDAVDLSVLASRLPGHGITVARFEQPWRTAGKKVASRPPKLDIAWKAAIPQLLHDQPQDLPYFFGGRSAGARVACRTAPEFDLVRGVVCCAFPLHPPGRPDRSRADELLGAGVPRLVLQGERDTFGGPDEVREAAAGDPAIKIITVPGADHSMRTTKNGPITPAELRDLITDSVINFVLR
ncbi:hydrolase [Microlunatus elymi]|uniref:Hydrolase n=2 Tax=Microlunatus elymi TaxID=2596828 RepID=A0A516Q5X3_9ACTN|nr:hydrolase [Microlunatus elymi]